MTVKEARKVLHDVLIADGKRDSRLLGLMLGTLSAMSFHEEHQPSVIWLANHVQSILQREEQRNGNAVQTSGKV